MNGVSIDRVAVAVVTRPGEGLACVHIAGDVDIAARPALDDAAHRLHVAAPDTVLVDLAAVTFACSTLVNFVVHLRNIIPDDGSLVLCRPTARTRRVLELTAVDVIATLRTGLPPQWDDGTPQRAVPQPRRRTRGRRPHRRPRGS